MLEGRQNAPIMHVVNLNKHKNEHQYSDVEESLSFNLRQHATIFAFYGQRLKIINYAKLLNFCS